MHPSTPDYSVVYNHLDLMLELPWEEHTEDSYDLKKAKKILDHDHYGMDKVKERILAKAADLFMRYGIRSITMDEIASQLGISKKTIYQFFTDKDDLVSAVIEREIKTNEVECLQYAEKAGDAVQEIFIAVEDLDEMLKYMNPLMLYDLEKHHPRSYRKLKEFKYEFLYGVIMDNLQWGIAEELYRPDIQLDITTKSEVKFVFR